MTAKARELRLSFPLSFAVGQNIDLGNFNSSSGALALTLRMLEVLRPLEAETAWDAHIGGDAFADADAYRRVLVAAREVFGRQGGATKLVVFEENGHTHNLRRALVHARMNIASSLFGDFMLMDTAANGLQVFGQNDNGWDQGQVFMTPDRVWLSPFGWSQSMLARHLREFTTPVGVTNLTSRELDVGAYVSAEGAVGLRVVNWGPSPVELSFRVAWKQTVPPAVEAEELTASSLEEVNPLEDPRRVSPRQMKPGSARLVSGVAEVRLPLSSYSFVTAALRPSVVVI